MAAVAGRFPLSHLTARHTCCRRRLSRKACLLENRPDHLIADSGRLRETRFEISLNLLETVTVACKVAEADALAPTLPPNHVNIRKAIRHQKAIRQIG